MELYYIKKETNSFAVMQVHIYARCVGKEDFTCAIFYFGEGYALSKTRALQAARVFKKMLKDGLLQPKKASPKLKK